MWIFVSRYIQRAMMPTQPLVLRLPEQLVRRFKRAIPARRRSKFVEELLEDALPPEDAGDDDPLYQAALAVEKDEALAAEMSANGKTD
jgi:hypothetical protein